MKVALVHDWITGMRGGERCLEAFLKLYPQADIFTLIHVPGASSAQIDERVNATSFFQKLPLVSRYYRLLLPLFPQALRSLDLSGYGLIISLSHAAAKNVKVPRGATHVCYCFTPMRYIWDQAPQYFGRLRFAIWPLINYLRRWDLKNSKGVTRFVGISRFVKARIRCFYKRGAEVIYPPVETNWITPLEEYRPGQAFLYAGALVPYKRAAVVIEAFNQLNLPLWVAGSGPEERRLKAIAGPNIRFWGQVSDQELACLYKNCRSLIFPAREDFGLIPIECLAAGRPVIASYEGALRETLPGLKFWSKQVQQQELACGVFIRPGRGNLVPRLVEAVSFLFLEHESLFSPKFCRKWAERFSSQRFFEEWRNFMSDLDRQHLNRAESGDVKAA